MDFEVEEFTEEEIDNANKVFARSCTFVLGVAGLSQLPGDDMNEVAFAGRSNVGKSSVINAVTNQRSLAKTSNTPGRTQQLNFFNLDDKLHIVDLPGYGFAKAPVNIVKKWQDLISTYLQGRSNLRRVFLLVDSRHGIKDVDSEIMKMLDKAAVTYQIVLTKIDKISKEEQTKVLAKTKEITKKNVAVYPKVLLTSSAKFYGIEELRAEIVSLI